jgi:hypothetical protein
VADPSTFSEELVQSFAAALGLTYEEMSADYDRTTEAQVQAQIDEAERALAVQRERANERMTRLLVAISSDKPDRLADLMLSSDRRQQKRGRRLYNQAKRAQWNARWATLEGLTF